MPAIYISMLQSLATRYGNILDLEFSSDADMIEDVDVHEPAVNRQ